MKAKNVVFSIGISVLSIFSACQKQNQVSPVSSELTDPTKATTITSMNYDRKDTSTQHKSKGALKVFDTGDVTFDLNYQGSGQYRMDISVDYPYYPVDFTYNLRSNNTVIESTPYQSSAVTLYHIFSAGTYDYSIQPYYESVSPIDGPYFTPNFAISAPPVVPAGYVPFLEYYNSALGKHYYDNDWEKFGSQSYDWVFYKNQGFMYANSTIGSTALYEYYNSGNSDHYYTTTYSSYSGYIYEGIVGFIPTSSSTTFPNALAEYYNSTTGEHFYSTTPPAGGTDFVFSKTVGYIQ